MKRFFNIMFKLTLKLFIKLFKNNVIHLIFVIFFINAKKPEVISKNNIAYDHNKWYQIQTPHFNINTTGDLIAEGHRIANLMERLNKYVPKSLDVKIKKANINIKNQRAISNGYAFPNNATFFVTPPQMPSLLGVNEWLNFLAVHEFRHIAQLEILKKKWFLPPFIPMWFIEGDAVVIETALTRGGRGRIPHWSLVYKVNLLEKGIYSYSKNYHGSFRSQTPGWYRMGYFFIIYLRKIYGKEIIGKILKKSITYWEPFFAFERAVKQITGKKLSLLYKEYNSELIKKWTSQLDNLYISPSTSIIIENDNDNYNYLYGENYIDYNLPRVLEDNSIIAYERGLDQISKFVRFKLRNEKYVKEVVYIPKNIEYGDFFSIKKNKLIWSETIPTSRWAFRENDVLYCYDINKKNIKILYEGLLKAPDISSDENLIVAVETNKSYQHSLVILDSKNGKIIKKIPNPKNNFISTPKWSHDGTKVLYIETQNQTKAIKQYDIKTGNIQQLSKYENENIYSPFLYNDYIFYNASYNGIDNIYVMNIKTGKRFQVTSKKYGAFNAGIAKNAKYIIFNNYTPNGMKIEKMPFNPNDWIAFNKIKDKNIRLYKPIVEQEGSIDVFSDIENKNYPVIENKKYLDTFNCIPHKIKPYFYLSPMHFEIDQIPFLKNFSASFCSTFDINNDKNYKLKLSIIKYFTIIDIGFSSIKARHKESKFTYNGFYGGMRIPLAFYDGGYKTFLEFSGGVFFKHGILQNTYSLVSDSFPKDALSLKNNIGNYSPSVFKYIGTNIKPQVRFTFLRTFKLSARDILPKHKQYFTVFSQFNEFKLDSTFHIFFPGILNHHSFNISLDLNINNKENELYEKSEVNHAKNIARCFITQVNYLLPICYIDFYLPSIFYTNLFYKFQTKLSYNDDEMTKNLFGLELGYHVSSFINLNLNAKIHFNQKPNLNLSFNIQL